MKLVTDKEKILSLLREHIKKFGHRPEHHEWLFLYAAYPESELNYFDFGDDGGIFAERSGTRWFISEEPIAPSAQRIDLFLKVLKYIFTAPPAALAGQKVSVEDWTEEFKNKCSEALRSLPYRILRPNTAQYCPVIDLEKFDATLSGRAMKRMRYARNRFLKNHKIEIQDAREVSADQMLNLLEVWGKMRTAHDAVWAPDYVKFIQNGFPECAIKRAVWIDGMLRGLSVGWRIPHSTGYYIAYNFSITMFD